MNEKSLKEIAIAKREFLASEFGQYAAAQINELYGNLHKEAESENITPEKKALLVDQAAGINKVISFFASDVALLEQGYFDQKEAVPKQR